MIAALRQHSDGSPQDERLCQLLEELWRHPDGSPKQRMAISRLIANAQNLPELLKSSHQDYESARNLTWEWLGRNIKNFQPGAPSIAKSLVRWINGYLYWRIRDLNSPDSQAPISLDVPIGDDEEGATRLDNIPNAPLSNLLNNVPALSGFHKYIANLETEQVQCIGLNLELYIEQDPQGKLRQCHPRNRPDCNCQLLAQRFSLKEPPDDFTEVAKEINISLQTLYSHWKRKCKPLLISISIEMGYQTSLLKQYIEEDLQGKLRQCYARNCPNCNCQLLAQRLLAIFQDPPDDLVNIAQSLGIKKSQIVQSHWDKKCLPLLTKIAIEQGYQPLSEL